MSSVNIVSSVNCMQKKKEKLKELFPTEFVI